MKAGSALPVVALCLLAAGCTTPMHLSYDYGRAYTQAFETQADLSRPSVAAAQHHLNGLEAFQIRLHVLQESSDKESAAPTLSGGGG